MPGSPALTSQQQFTRAMFSRKATTNLRRAMALALKRHLECLAFENLDTFQFSAVFDNWPSYLERYVPASACVLPGRWTYGDAYLTPVLLEDTWEPKGELGFALYKTSELEVQLEVSIRTDSVDEREAIILGVENSFVDPDLLMADPAGARYGILLPLPEYYGCNARFQLIGGSVIDDEDRAMRENRDAIMTVRAEASQVVVGPVRPLALKFRETVGPNVDLENC